MTVRKGEPEDWINIMERLRSKWSFYDFQHFINGIKKEGQSFFLCDSKTADPAA